MDLLSTILRSCKAEKYIENFKEHQVDSFTLKLLNHEDLKIIGVNDEEHRNNILKHIDNLQIPCEKRVNTKVDSKYIILVLNQISIQLHKHYALLTYGLKREDVDLCNVKVTPLAVYLQKCLLSMEKELNTCEQKVTDTNPRRKHSKAYLLLFPTVVATSLAMLLCRFYVVYTR